MTKTIEEQQEDLKDAVIKGDLKPKEVIEE